MLIECQECRSRISDKAERCPRCGVTAAKYLGQPVVCSECSAKTYQAYTACSECGAPSSHKTANELEPEATEAIDNLSSVPRKVFRAEARPTEVTSQRLRARSSTSPLLHRAVVVVQSALIVGGLIWMVGGLVSAYEFFVYENVGSLISNPMFWIGFVGYLLMLVLCGAIAYLALGKFKILPHSDKAGLKVLLHHFLAWIAAAICIEFFFFNPLMAGMLIGGIGVVGVQTRLVWWPVSMLRSLPNAATLYVVVTAILVPSYAYYANIYRVTPEWPLEGRMAPYFIALAFWYAFDLSFPRTFIPKYLFNDRRDARVGAETS